MNSLISTIESQLRDENAFIDSFQSIVNDWDNKGKKREKKECTFIITKGDRKGEKCGVNTSRSTNEKFCSKHTEKNH